MEHAFWVFPSCFSDQHRKSSQRLICDAREWCPLCVGNSQVFLTLDGDRMVNSGDPDVDDHLGWEMEESYLDMVCLLADMGQVQSL